MKALFGICIIFVCTIYCAAETIIVAKDGSGDFTLIQDAIDYSWDEDTVILKPAVWTGWTGWTIRF